MKLRGIEFGNVFNASGARGFFGEAYWFHKWWKFFGLDFTGSTFVAKTTTLLPRKGNMLLGPDNQPLDAVPDCIVVKPWKGVALNAVGLSGPGALTLTHRWADTGFAKVLDGVLWTAPEKFMLSFMSIAPTVTERLRETLAFSLMVANVVAAHGRDRVALQVNFSCPNVGRDLGKYADLADEIRQTLSIMEPLGIALLIKVNALFPPDVVRDVVEGHQACDGVIVSNTIPWGSLPDKIDWKGLFGSDVSPLAKYGGGGLSGKPLLPLVHDWIIQARMAGVKKNIVGGGGILSGDDAYRLLDAGADAVELGSVAFLRPWRVHKIIEAVNYRLGK